MIDTIHIGTRGSQLALWQTNWVQEKLQKQFSHIRFETEIVKTTGDKILDVPLAKIGDKGLFTKELDVALLNGNIDFAVHSLKDLPTQIPDELTIGAITERWDVRDALVSKKGVSLEWLPQNATIATGSLRRKAQLLAFRPGFRIVDIRGNLNTRMRKFDESGWDAMILAVAGIERLGWHNRIAEKISTEIILPAVGQGSFAVICRKDDTQTLEILNAINHALSAIAAAAERAMLQALEGGCQVPIGALAEVTAQKVKLTGCICELDGSKFIRETIIADLNGKNDIKTASELGMSLADRLLQAGGREILNAITVTTDG